MVKSPVNKMIGQTARLALLHAIVEKRVIIGISSAINILSKTPEDSLFCFLAKPKVSDSATHMNETLLEAFCYEHDIYIVKVDNAEKLSRILGLRHLETCALIQKTWMPDRQTELLTDTENRLVDYCEQNWDFPNQIMELPV